MNRISSKLLSLFLLVAAVPLVIASVINIGSTRESLLADVENTLNAIADYKTLQIREYLENQENMVKLVSKSPVIVSAFENFPDAYAEGVDSPAYLEIESRLRSYLEFFGNSARFTDIYLITDDGEIIFSLQRKPDFATNLFDGPFAESPLSDSFNLALSMFSPNFTGFHPYAASGNDYSAFVSVPVFRYGMPIGTVTAQMKNDALFEFSTDYTGLYQTGEVLLGKLELESVLLVAPLRHDADSAYRRRFDLNADPDSPLELAARGADNSGRHVDYRGKAAISAWRYLPKLQWGLMIKIDEDEVLVAGRHLVEQLVYQVLISLAGVGIAAFFISRGLSRPITRLLAATRKIAAGDFEHRVMIASRDEIGELGDSFNEMTRQLKQSLQKSEAAAIAKTEFLTTMSHEIRTPMNGVLGMAQLLENTELTPEQREYVKTISGSGNNLMTIINDILDFSKLDTAAVEIEAIPFNLEHIGRECLDLIMPTTDEHSIELVLDYQPDAPRYFIGDPTRLRQVIMNFLGNAIKFTEQGFVRFAVNCKVSANQRAALEIDVEDSGIGISPAQQGHLFEEFTQADQSTSRRYGGTGLGLAISKKITDLMGAKIELESAAGQGSRFRVKIELEIADTPEVIPDEGLQDARVLIIGAHKENCKILQRLLSHFGMRITLLERHAPVVELLQREQLAGNAYRFAIFCGQHNPQGDIGCGLEIRAAAELDELRLMVFSPSGQRGDAGAFHRAGFDAYLSKINSRDDLHDLLLALLNKKPGDALITHHSVLEAPRSRVEETQFSGSILLVEDVPTNQIIAKTMLKSMGFEVDIAADGQQAVDAVAKKSYDLIFMDCLMPVMDGYQATMAIRECESAARRTTIIALTANTSEDDVVRCEQSGMDGIVTKPFYREDLLTCISRHLDLKQAS